MHKHVTLLLWLAWVSGCGAPNINALQPDNGPERTLVRVDGNTLFASVQWDAATASETTLPSGWLGAYMFSVPPGAALGPHDVRLRRDGGTGNIVPFTVTAQQPFGAPRLERVSLVGTEFKPANQVNTWMLVQGANVDVGAEVLVNGVVQPTTAFKALVNDLLGVPPQDLGYPIYHYLALLCAPGDRTAGSTLDITVRNLDGQMSNPLSYTLPADAASLDSDGDDLPDQMELNGFDSDGNGTIDVNLPSLGAHPFRPDVFLELDVMAGLANPPGPAAFQAVQDAFAAAPIINGLLDDGIHMVLDTSGSVPFSSTINLQGADNPMAGFTNFYTLKGANFDNAVRGRIYHYGIWANAHPGGFSGISDVDVNAAGTDFAGPGDDFIVSFDDFNAAFQTARSGAETMMHEFGHNLQQRHGGGDHSTRKPVYSSVMSYSWQLRTGLSAAARVARPVYFPFYYGQNGAAEIGGALPAAGAGNVIDYSEGMGRSLDEATLDETVGLHNGLGIDWNGDGDALDTNVAADADRDGTPGEMLVDFPNWIRLVFSGPRLNGDFGM